MNFAVIGDPDEATREAVNSVLREYNRTNNPIFHAAQEASESGAQLLNVIAADADGQIVGGLFGETRFAWLRVSIMAVRSEFRGAGIGARVLDTAEREAILRGCKHAYIDTMDYQAPGFYQKRGYAVAGRIEDWDSHGHAKIFLTKTLTRG